MQLTSLQNRIIISGNIKTVSDFQEIKMAVDELISQTNHIKIEILESISITSSVIGYFNMLVHVKKVDLSIDVKSSNLIDVLEDLCLIKTFKVRLV